MTRLSAIVLGFLVGPLLMLFFVIGAVAYIAKEFLQVGYQDGQRLIRWIRAEWTR